ncbi:UxaA family hydrolase [Blautia liquoris]|uniref:UxaA family hydrolase n=1 Tax=Blautia liquoris TaxID=2779518 RepID=A0A7M2RHB2_9FIRM|nr:UxaA family hydrolase [Blautia liquoris]
MLKLRLHRYAFGAAVVCSRNEMNEMWADLIDINAGSIITGESDIKSIGTKLYKPALIKSSWSLSFSQGCSPPVC